MKAWIARDKNGELYLYFNKPSKGEHEWDPESGDFLKLNIRDFQQVQWEDEEPIVIKI